MRYLSVRNEVLTVSVSSSDNTEWDLPLHQPQPPPPFWFPTLEENWVGGFVAYSWYLTKDGKFCFSALAHFSCPASCKHMCCSWLCPNLNTIGISPSTLIFGYTCHFLPRHSSAKALCLWRILTSVIYFVTTFVCLFFDSCCGLASVWKFQSTDPASLPGYLSQSHAIFSSRFLGFHSSCWLVPGASAPT